MIDDINDGKWHRWRGASKAPPSLHPNSTVEVLYLPEPGKQTVVKNLAVHTDWAMVLAFRVEEDARDLPPLELELRFYAASGEWIGKHPEGASRSYPDTIKVKEVK